jgi:HlyD family secretion protein
MYQLLRLADYQASAIQHENNLRRLKANREVKRMAHDQMVARAKAALEKASLELKRAPVLSDIKAEKNRLTYEEAQATYRQVSSEEDWVMTSESAAVHASELDLRVAQMELERAQRNAERMIVRSPIDGMVVMMTLRRGGENSQIQEGDQVWPGQPYMQIVDRSSMVVDAMVNQVDAQRLRLGMPARVRFDAFPDLELPAEVTAVGGSAQSRGWRGSWVRSVPVRLRLEETEERVIPDLSVSADLVLDSVEDAVVIPREAVFSGSDGEPFAWVRGQSGWEKHPLELGLSNNTSVAVISGVDAGAVVAAGLPSEEPGNSH